MGISLWAMNNYMSDENNKYGLFKDITLTPLLNKTTLLDYLFTLYEMDEVQLQTPSLLKKQIDSWFAANYENFNRMAEVLFAEYNPLENYNRTEETSENRDTTNAYNEQNSDTSQGASAATSSGKGSSASSGNSTIGTSNSEHTVSADNESTYQPESKDIESSHTDVTSNSSVDQEESNSNTTSAESREGNKAGTNLTDDDFTRNSHIFGNIGIMTSQQMAQQTLDLYKFNLYEYISTQFAIKFLFEVW